VRMLLPTRVDDVNDAALDDAYAWPAGPWLRANMVATVDGAARGPDGLSGAISSVADKRVFGVLRALADVVLVGAGTVRAEGYRAARARAAYAERRAAAGQRPAPVIAVVSRSLNLDPALPLFADPMERPVVLTATTADPARRQALADVADVADCGDADVDPREALRALRERGLGHVVAEGGPHLLAQLVDEDLLDELCLTVSPLLVGGTGDAGRILSGVGNRPHLAGLGHVLEEDGMLFLRYVLQGAS
jgi:riboflavin biosynthesis pyrimidine reductase